jgi:hypothetical protein
MSSQCPKMSPRNELGRVRSRLTHLTMARLGRVTCAGRNSYTPRRSNAASARAATRSRRSKSANRRGRADPGATGCCTEHESGPDQQNRASIRHAAVDSAELLPALAGKCLHAAACMYSNTPDRHFVIGRHPQCADVIMAVRILRARLQICSGGRRDPCRPGHRSGHRPPHRVVRLAEIADRMTATRRPSALAATVGGPYYPGPSCRNGMPPSDALTDRCTGTLTDESRPRGSARADRARYRRWCAAKRNAAPKAVHGNQIGVVRI